MLPSKVQIGREGPKIPHCMSKLRKDASCAWLFEPTATLPLTHQGRIQDDIHFRTIMSKDVMRLSISMEFVPELPCIKTTCNQMKLCIVNRLMHLIVCIDTFISGNIFSHIRTNFYF